VETEPVEVPGHGSVLSYTTLVAAPEGFKAPLLIAVVELSGGARIFCHCKQEHNLTIGQRVAIEQVDGVFYFAHLNLADRVAMFWKRGGSTRARAAGAVKGTAKRLAAFASALKEIGHSSAPGRKTTEANEVVMETENVTGGLPLVMRAQLHSQRTAIVDAAGVFTYDQLLDASARVASVLLDGRNDLREARIPFLITPGFPWVAVQWGIWRAGGIAVPLPQGTPAAELEYFIADAQATLLVADAAGQQLLAPIAQKLRLRLLSYDEVLLASPAAPLPSVESRRRAMILYTSGTTSRPKGVVTTHDNIMAQVSSLVRAWQWSAEDRILLCLPLHHIHGIVNVVSCALWSGAVCDMLPRFDAEAVWDHIAGGHLTVFMAVPTIYAKLIAAWEAAVPQRQTVLSQACAKLRLMVSGSAALPVATLGHWKQISGHTLLERYGMTEIGMALSNPLEGERLPGSVGAPLPGVDLQLVDEPGNLVEPGTPGEIEVRGPAVFPEYWGKPEATAQAFRDGWFRTGDVALFENGRYRILGRLNSDIIKTGGNKLSALEVEELLREHPAIAECAVVGVPDPEWGERVAAAVILRPGSELDLPSLRSWAKERVASYKIPSLLLVVDELPRNAMGKLTKPAVVDRFKSRQAA
jgi:malonyl-CoA/methylmalonyl-CoA synthetase